MYTIEGHCDSPIERIILVVVVTRKVVIEVIAYFLNFIQEFRKLVSFRCNLPELVYYESIKRELNKRLIFECRCDARLKANAEESTRLTYTRCHVTAEFRHSVSFLYSPVVAKNSIREHGKRSCFWGVNIEQQVHKSVQEAI